MHYLIQLLIDGHTEADMDRLLTSRNESKATRAIANYCLACAPHLAPEEQDIAEKQLDDDIVAALASPGLSSTMSMAVLLVALRWSQEKGREDDCIRYARMLSQLADDRVPPMLKLAVCVEELKLWRSTDNPTCYDAVHQRAVSLKPKTGIPLWIDLWRNYLLEMVNRREAKLAKATLQKLETFARNSPASQLDSFNSLKAFYCFSFGKVEEGLQLFENTDLAEASRSMGQSSQIHTMLLIFAGRVSEAEERLNEISISSSEEDFSNLDVIRGYSCLAQRDINGARRLAQRAISRPGSLGIKRTNAMLLLVNIELVERRASAARRLLRSLDPRENRPYFDMQWARLYVLEEEMPKAATYFARILEQQLPEYVEDRVRFAYELSSYELARLYRLAVDAEPAGFTAQAIQSGGNSPLGHPSSSEKTANAPESGKVQWIGDSEESRKVRELVRQFAPLEGTVLITGETGTGKEVAARLLHEEGNRRKEPFLPIHCGALSETLMESELFGHVKGAFTGATSDRKGLLLAAGRGIVFLDEIHTMAPRLQAALLRVLENREVRPVGSTQFAKMQARVVAATNEDLLAAIADGRFREDLYYRLNALDLHLPPLRDRRSDVMAIARHFLQSAYKDFDVALDPGFDEALVRRAWPGNVRELRHVIERTVMLAGSASVLTAQHLERATGGTDPLVGSSNNENDLRQSQVAQNSTLANPSNQLGPAKLPGNPRNLRLRRARLREEFMRYRQLSRGQVAELLGCAPDTAGRDLKALEKEGFVRRVETSAHPRTGYYEI